MPDKAYTATLALPSRFLRLCDFAWPRLTLLVCGVSGFRHAPEWRADGTSRCSLCEL